MKISPEECLKENLFNRKAYSRPDGKRFIEACREGRVRDVETLLARDKYLVYDFDFAEQTGLHWAAKRDKLNVVKYLLMKGAYPDSTDIGHRTPLFLASKAGHYKTCLALLE